MFKKGLRYVVGTIIFISFSPIWILIDWILEDDATLISSTKAAIDNWKSLVEPIQLQKNEY